MGVGPNFLSAKAPAEHLVGSARNSTEIRTDLRVQVGMSENGVYPQL